MTDELFYVECNCGREVPESELAYPVDCSGCVREEPCAPRKRRVDDTAWPMPPQDDDDDVEHAEPIRPIYPVEA